MAASIVGELPEDLPPITNLEPQANLGRVALVVPRCGPPSLPAEAASEELDMPWQDALGPLSCLPVSKQLCSAF